MNPETAILDDSAVSEIEAQLEALSERGEPWESTTEKTDTFRNVASRHALALCATVKHLRSRQVALEQALRPLWAISVPSGTPEPENMEQLISDLKQLPRNDLQSQLEQLQAENERLRNEMKDLTHINNEYGDRRR